MKDALWFAGILLLPLFGLWTGRIPVVARMDRWGRWAIALAGGMVTSTLVMFVWSVLGISWTRVSVGLPLMLGAAASVWMIRRYRAGDSLRRPEGGGSAGWKPALLLGVVVVLLTVYGVMTARETCADLLYFWGPKAVRFHRAGGIHVTFLRYPHYLLMHSDYPPLLPLVYSWGSLVARKFSWWGALAMTPLLLVSTVAAFRGLARDAVGDAAANQFTLLLTAILGYGFAVGMVAGAGDPPLLFFETITLAALTFGNSRGAWALAALGLTGAVLTKVEGSAFAAVVLIAFVLTRRKLLPAIAVAIPPLVAIGSWILFARHHQLLDTYGKSEKGLRPDVLGMVLTTMGQRMSYSAFYLPWIASLAPLGVGRDWRRAAFPLLTGLGVIAYTTYFYLHEPEPQWWIESSAERVLLTALMSFVVASAAANTRRDPVLESAPDGVVP